MLLEKDLRDGCTIEDVIKALDFTQCHLSVMTRDEVALFKTWVLTNEIRYFDFNNRLDSITEFKVSNKLVKTVDIKQTISIIKFTQDPHITIYLERTYNELKEEIK